MRILEKEGFVLAAITGMFYLKAYFNILSKANFYDVPIEVMNVDLFQLTQAAIGSGVSLGAMVFLPLIIYFWVKFGAKKPKFIFSMVIMSIIPVLGYFSLRKENESVALILSGALFLSFFIVYLTMSMVARDQAFTNRLVSEKIPEIMRILSLTRTKIFLISFFCVLTILSGYVSAYISCYSIKYYDVFNKNGIYAVVNSSSEGVVAKKVIDGKLGGGYFLFKAEELVDIEIKKQDINSLDAKDNKEKHFYNREPSYIYRF